MSEPSTLKSVRDDVFGGLTAGIVALPLALAFGVSSGLDRLVVDGVPLNGAFAGLVGAIAVGVLAAAFGGTPAQISGPTGPLTIVAAGFISTATGDPRWAFATIALAGVFQVLFGVLRLGRYVNYVPYPVISGFMSGIGIIIVILQVPPLLGWRPPVGNPVEALRGVPTYLAQANLTALLAGLATIGFVYVTPRLTRVVPGTLVALIAVTLVAVSSGLDVHSLGAIPAGVPRPMVPPFSDLNRKLLLLVVETALILAALASIDTLLTSLVADQITATRHDSDRELVGQGIGNAVAGLLGGLPGAGATMRTVVNVRSGGRGRLSGIVHGLFLLAVLLGLGRYAAYIPRPVLAGILATVGIGIIDWRGLRDLRRTPWGDAAVMLLVLLLTVFQDLITAVGVGMVAASLLLVKRLSDADPATQSPLVELARTRPWFPRISAWVTEPAARGMYVLQLHGSLFFGNATPLQRKVEEARDALVVILLMNEVRYLDQSGAYALKDVLERYHAAGTTVLVTGLQPAPADLLRRLAVVPGIVPADAVVPRLDQAVAVATAIAERKVKERGHGAAASLSAPVPTFARGPRERAAAPAPVPTRRPADGADGSGLTERVEALERRLADLEEQRSPS